MTYDRQFKVIFVAAYLVCAIWALMLIATPFLWYFGALK